jgi:type VI protein secretion system component Hcp
MGKPKKTSGKKTPKDLNVKTPNEVKGGLVITKTVDKATPNLMKF